MKLNANYVERDQILETIVAKPFVSIIDQNGKNIDDIYVQVRKNEEDYIAVLMNINKHKSFEKLKLEFSIGGFCEKWDVRSGEKSLIAKGDKIIFEMDFQPLTELCVVITKKDNGFTIIENESDNFNQLSLGNKFRYRLHEPNVCVLDFVDYKLGSDEWKTHREIIRADREIRTSLSLPLRGGMMLQPWFVKSIKNEMLCDLKLRFKFWIDEIPEELKLAVETPEEFVVKINGNELCPHGDEYWVDSCYKVISLNKDFINIGENVITLECGFNRDIDLESLYLLGGFCVTLDGSKATLTEMPETVSKGDLTEQGFPFYGGDHNV